MPDGPTTLRACLTSVRTRLQPGEGRCDSVSALHFQRLVKAGPSRVTPAEITTVLQLRCDHVQNERPPFSGECAAAVCGRWILSGRHVP